MYIKEILERVKIACTNISDTDPGVWHTSEWNICSHIRQRLLNEFSGYNIDVELIKNDGRRPDIVIHRRGNNLENLVVFQVKIDPSKKDINDDLEKIRNTFFNAPYFYKFGIFISIGKLPDSLPKFDSKKIGILEVYGWREMDSEGNLI